MSELLGGQDPNIESTVEPEAYPNADKLLMAIAADNGLQELLELPLDQRIKRFALAYPEPDKSKLKLTGRLSFESSFTAFAANEALFQPRKGDYKPRYVNDEEGLAAFWRRLSELPLLTHEGEAHFGKTYQAGLYAAASLGSNYDAYSAEELKRLSQIMYEGLVAREVFVSMNLRLVVKIASKSRKHDYDTELAVLINEGIIGLYRAAETFDPKKGYKFSGHAKSWIQKKIGLALHYEDGAMRIPIDEQREYVRFRREVIEPLTGQLGYTPSESEIIASDLSYSPEEVRKLLRIGTLMEPHKSIYEPYYRGDTTKELIDYTEVPDAVSVEDDVEQRVIADLLNSHLGEHLTEELQGVLQERLQGVSMEAIGERLGVTRQRIEQMVAITRARLQHPSSFRFIQTFRSSDLASNPWKAEGACVDEDTGTFFPRRGGNVALANEAAKRICQGCVVREECGDFASSQKIPYGIWGGQTTAERRRPSK